MNSESDGTSFSVAFIHYYPTKRFYNSFILILRSLDFFCVNAFTTPGLHTSTKLNSPVGTVLYDRVYNDDLVSIKVQPMNIAEHESIA